jgi:hypothetical protein
MGRLVVNNAMTVNGAFEAPSPDPDGWLVLDADSNQVSLEQFLVADAMVLGRKTYEGLAADLRWCRAGPPGADRGDDLRLRRGAAGLPASTRPAGRRIPLGPPGRAGRRLRECPQGHGHQGIDVLP